MPDFTSKLAFFGTKITRAETTRAATLTQPNPKTQFIFQKRLDFKIFMNSKSVIYFYLVSMSIWRNTPELYLFSLYCQARLSFLR